MKKPTDHDVVTELFRDRGIDFNNSNGNIQAGDAELIFTNTGRLLSVHEFEHDAEDCELCGSVEVKVDEMIADLENADKAIDREALLKVLRSIFDD